MTNYLLKILYLLITSIVVIFTYYFTYTTHLESFSNYTPYLIFLIISYWVYKVYNLFFYTEKLNFKIIHLFYFFLLHLLILSVLFFLYNWNPAWYWIILFVKILFYLLIPTIIIFSSISFWKYLLWKIKWFLDETSIFQFLFSLWIWFFSFVTILTLIWFLGFYNIFSVIWIIILFLWISHKEALETLSLLNTKLEIENHNINWNTYEKFNLNLLTTEFLFIILTFLLSVNLINIVRPMPIGWDDLWVYMNYPQLLANAWEIFPIWWILTWQIFTWIWYMFKSATQAFFLNNVWWILSALVIILSLKEFLKSDKKSFINIPLLWATIFTSMPMVIFQQAKDMKLDPWLFFISSIIVYLVISIFLKYFESDDKQKFFSKKYLIYILLIWVLAWFAFSIKLTSLLLISWIIWVVFYSKLWISWFLGYVFTYIWIFTKFWLWDLLNVAYPKDDVSFKNYTFLVFLVLAIASFSYSIYKFKIESFKKTIIVLWIFLVWIISSLSPWLVKNTLTLDWNISIPWILWWKWEWFNLDYTKIYSKEELETIKKNNETQAINSTWTTTNEDLWRYFWYENWINNYMKLPYNLTMQTNQKWEYTDITYIFIAILPIIILFLVFSNYYASTWYFLITLIPFLIFFTWHINSFLWVNILPDLNIYFTSLFSWLTLPYWYIFIFLSFLAPTIYLVYFLKNERLTTIFKINLIFVSFYTLLWTISAFWIVWYWIVMYYSFILIIAIWLKYLSSYDFEDEFKVNLFKFFSSSLTFFIIALYFLNSSIPHWFTNLTSSWYANFKSWNTQAYVSIFESHEDYFKVLLELNIAKDKREEILKQIKSETKDQVLTNILSNVNDLVQLNEYLTQIANTTSDPNIPEAQLAILRNESNKIRNKLYYQILYPSKDFKNQDWIYRIGTFLRYFISDNTKRLLEDSLIFEFDKYFYDEKNIEVWVDRMKKIWVNYFLVDLNAATIDKDPRRALTTRYEHLLKTFTSSKLELVSTDSYCLQMALENYNKSQKTVDDLNKYMINAWVNYESYDENWNLTLARTQKQISCYNEMLTLIQENKVDENNYKYLLPVKEYITANWIDSEEKLYEFFVQNISHGWMVLFKIK